MKSIYLFLLLSIFSCNPTSEEKTPVAKKDSGNNFGMRSFEPVVVDTPHTLTFKFIPDSSDYVIHISDTAYSIEHGNKTIAFENLQGVESYINKNTGNLKSEKIAIEAHSKKSYKLVQSLIATLKKCGFDHFNLITDLEK